MAESTCVDNHQQITLSNCSPHLEPLLTMNQLKNAFGTKQVKKAAAPVKKATQVVKKAAPKPKAVVKKAATVAKKVGTVAKKAAGEAGRSGGVGYRKYDTPGMWLPNADRPEWLDGSMIGTPFLRSFLWPVRLKGSAMSVAPDPSGLTRGRS